MILSCENFGEIELLGKILAKKLGTIMLYEKITNLQRKLDEKNVWKELVLAT